ncbi:MAG: hypothetical protein NVSMB18_03060 [Acetobacteraceae bacterium]
MTVSLKVLPTVSEKLSVPFDVPAPVTVLARLPEVEKMRSWPDSVDVLFGELKLTIGEKVNAIDAVAGPNGPAMAGAAANAAKPRPSRVAK